MSGSSYCTITGTDALVVAAANPGGVTTEIVVFPAAKGVKFVLALPEPPVIVTGEAIDPTAALLVVRLTVTDAPPATCSTNAKLLSVFS